MKRRWGIIGALILLGIHVACGSEDDTSSPADDTSPDAASTGDAASDARADPTDAESDGDDIVADAANDGATTDAADGSTTGDSGFDAGYCFVNATDPLNIQDLDSDGVSVAMGDCNDCDPSIRPGVGCP